MGTGAWRGSLNGRRATAAVVGILAAASLAACGSSDFANNPPPPDPIVVAAKIDANRVAVSPNNFGAGLIAFTVNNFSKSSVRFELSGPKRASTAEISPGEPGFLKVDLPEGDYTASAAGIPSGKSATFTVGARRPSSKNKLLLP
jgi:hypothetical protein